MPLHVSCPFTAFGLVFQPLRGAPGMPMGTPFEFAALKFLRSFQPY